MYELGPYERIYSFVGREYQEYGRHLPLGRMKSNTRPASSQRTYYMHVSWRREGPEEKVDFERIGVCEEDIVNVVYHRNSESWDILQGIQEVKRN